MDYAIEKVDSNGQRYAERFAEQHPDHAAVELVQRTAGVHPVLLRGPLHAGGGADRPPDRVDRQPGGRERIADASDGGTGYQPDGTQAQSAGVLAPLLVGSVVSLDAGQRVHGVPAGGLVLLDLEDHLHCLVLRRDGGCARVSEGEGVRHHVHLRFHRRKARLPS